MNTEILKQASVHAVREFPRESCGLIIAVDGGERYYACRNIAETPSEHFIIAPEDYADASDMGAILGVVHSHPNTSARPSSGDLVACEASQLPWHILAVFKDSEHPEPAVVAVESIAPKGYKEPLVGRTFCHGILDCYSIIKDYYSWEMGIELPDYARRDLWWEKGDDLYMTQFEQAGFVQIDKLDQVGDIILMQIRSKVANHAGIYVGDGKFLHHLYGRASSIDVFGGQWLHNTRAYLRYNGTL